MGKSSVFPLGWGASLILSLSSRCFRADIGSDWSVRLAMRAAQSIDEPRTYSPTDQLSAGIIASFADDESAEVLRSPAVLAVYPWRREQQLQGFAVSLDYLDRTLADAFACVP